MSKINRNFVQQPTAFAAAMLDVTAKEFKAALDKGVDHPETSPSVPWMARRVALCDTSLGLKRVPTISYPVRM